jgi:hypothetical protein
MALIIQDGDVFAELGGSVESWLISKLTGAVSHVGIFSGRTCGDPACYDYEHILVTQALAHGITTIALAESVATARYAYCLHAPDISAADRQKMAEYARKMVGTGYAFGNLFWQAVKQITGDPKWTEFMDADGTEICSQFAALDYLTVDRDFGLSPRDCTPTDCLNYALANKWAVQPIPKA